MKFLKRSPLPQIAKKVFELQTEKEIQDFFKAFLTPKEVKVLGDRYRVVEMLLKGKPQREISQKLGVSISQISRGSEELQFGVGAEIFPNFFKEITKK